MKDIHAFNALFEGLAVRTDEHFREAYNQARLFGKVLGKRGKGGGFMKNLMQQRICSSLMAGINTATALLKGLTLHEEFDDIEEDVALQTDEERAALEQLLHRLKKIDSDPKFEAVLHFLINEGWLEHGCIIEKMDQYIDAQKRATGFDLRYNAHLAASDKDWRDCSDVLSQRDFGTLMREGWEK